MPTRTANPQSRGRTAAKSKSSSTVEIVVRRGASKRFSRLKNETTELPVVVSWDRREIERRNAKADGIPRERRQGDRRQKPPFTWELADFVLVCPPRGAARKKKTARKKPSGR